MAIDSDATWWKLRSPERCFPSDLEIPGLTEDGRRLKIGIKNSCNGPKLIIIMVGLPARGKSYISRKLARYLNWLQYDTKVFNAGQTRRNDICRNEPMNGLQKTKISHPAAFFDPDDASAVALRNEIAMHTLDDLLLWLQKKSSCVGILDATNSTVSRREAVLDRIRAIAGTSVEVFFLESACNNHDLLEKNIRLKLSGPDYKLRDKAASLADFRRRIQFYEKTYSSMGSSESEQEVPYLQLIDLGRRLVANCINGFLSAQTVEYLLNLRLHERQIWITRNGESLDDVEGRIGRSSRLSIKGTRFASALARFINDQRILWESKRKKQRGGEDLLPTTNDNSWHSSSETQSAISGCHIWTSMMQQAMETSQSFDGDEYQIKHLRMLNDLHAGNMEGLTFQQIALRYSDEMAMRRANPVYYRWPGTGGESYADVIHRVRPVILELERLKDPVLLITHRAVARVLLAYFQELNWDEITEVDFPPGRVFAVEPMPYGVTVESYQYDESSEQFCRLTV